MSELKLRDYQRDAIHAVFNAWNGGIKRPAIVLPTGAGKTVVFAHLIKMFVPWADDDTVPGIPVNHGRRVMVLVHRDELADQAINKIRQVAPDLNVGKVKAERNEVDADVLVCSVQTLASARRLADIVDHQRYDGHIGLIITDECHHGAAPTYKKIYAAFPDALNLGVTATLARGDGVGLGDVWDEVVYSRSVLKMIADGHLTDVGAKRVEAEGLDLGTVKKSRGDYAAGDLGRAMEDSGVDQVIARAYKEHASDRPGVVFTPTVATAESAAEALNKIGIRTAVISGETSREDRLKIFDEFRRGDVQILSNCMVLTEGFDAPWASCAVIARPTQSNPLYVQMVGRVLRPWPGKKDALVLDVVGASGANKLQTLVDLEPGAVQQIGEDETLAEAVVREAEEEKGRQSLARANPMAYDLKVRSVSLFSSSNFAWLKTPAGVLFLSAGENTVFLWPSEEPGLWDVCYVTKGVRKWNKTQYLNRDLTQAMAWGEVAVEDLGSFNVQKSASWRKSARSEAQENVARSLGIDFEGMQRGNLSDAISIAIASRTFDSYAKKFGVSS